MEIERLFWTVSFVPHDELDLDSGALDGDFPRAMVQTSLILRKPLVWNALLMLRRLPHSPVYRRYT